MDENGTPCSNQIRLSVTKLENLSNVRSHGRFWKENDEEERSMARRLPGGGGERGTPPERDSPSGKRGRGRRSEFEEDTIDRIRRLEN